MVNEENKNLAPQERQSQEINRKQQKQSLETEIGAVGGGLAGAALGSKLIGGKTGVAMGTLAGAVVGGVLGEVVGEDLEELEQKAMKILGEAPGENEIPAHYSWDELQVLSKSQN